MLKKLFIDHPTSVGESYFEHMGVAFSFGFQMMGAACACIIHGLVPGLFQKTGSKTIVALHTKLMSNTCRAAALDADMSLAQTGSTQKNPGLRSRH